MFSEGDHENISRQKRSSPTNSLQKSVQTAADVKLLIKNFYCCRNKSVPKMKRSADQDQKGAEDDGEDLELGEDPVQKDLLENMGP